MTCAKLLDPPFCACMKNNGPSHVCTSPPPPSNLWPWQWCHDSHYNLRSIKQSKSKPAKKKLNRAMFSGKTKLAGRNPTIFEHISKMAKESRVCSCPWPFNIILFFLSISFYLYKIKLLNSWLCLWVCWQPKSLSKVMCQLHEHALKKIIRAALQGKLYHILKDGGMIINKSNLTSYYSIHILYIQSLLKKLL